MAADDFKAHVDAIILKRDADLRKQFWPDEPGPNASIEEVMEWAEREWRKLGPIAEPVTKE